MLATQQTREQLLPLVAAYHAAKTAREVIDYGDQMAIAARIATRHPEVGAAERSRYQVVLLDEYQDTSHAQLVLLRALFSGGHPVTAVGDPCQSIYGWRGASAGNLRRFRADFPVHEGRPAPVLLLSTSFRNTGRVLRAAGALQAELRAAAPEVPMLVAPPGRADRGQVSCALLESAGAEADWVAGQVAGLLSLESRPARRTASRGRTARRTPVRPSDIAVLCRKRAQFPAIRAALEARGHPGRGGRPRRPAHRPRGRRHRRDAAGPARPDRLRRAGPAAGLAPVADRPGRPGRARAAGPARWPARPTPPGPASARLPAAGRAPATRWRRR